jgi:fructokinase
MKFAPCCRYAKQEGKVHHGRTSGHLIYHMHLWGIDLGGTKIEGTIIDPSQPKHALCRLRLPTEANLGYDHVIDQIGRLVGQLKKESGLPYPPAVGLGTPGVVEPATGLMKNSNTVCLNKRALPKDLSTKLGMNAHVANDANCFALAEATLGAAKNRRVVLGLIIGTGTGAGIVVNGQILTGCHGIAGEWGHNPIADEKTPCYCGKAGCVETVIAGPSLERFYFGLTGVALRLPEIVRLAGSRDPSAMATLDRLRAKFAQAIAAVLNILDPDVVVIGGGVGNLDLLYENETRVAIVRHLFNSELNTEFLKPALGDSAGVFGAALLTAQNTG